MKTKFLLLFTVLLANQAISQRNVDYSMYAINPQIISQNIVMESEQTSLSSNGSDFVGFINKPIYANTDTFVIGGGYTYMEKNSFSNVELSVGRMGSTNEKFRMTLVFGYYQLQSQDTTTYSNNLPYNRMRQATYAGASLSYHFNDNKDYVGLAVKDLYDVCISDGEDSVYYLYEAMSPTLFAHYTLWDNNIENIAAYGDIMYNAEQKFTYSVAVEYNAENFKIAGFYNENIGALFQYNFEWIKLMASGTKDNITLGVTIVDFP